MKKIIYLIVVTLFIISCKSVEPTHSVQKCNDLEKFKIKKSKRYSISKSGGKDLGTFSKRK